MSRLLWMVNHIKPVVSLSPYANDYFENIWGLLTDSKPKEEGKAQKKIDIDITDPVADSFYKETWIRIASLNTKIYEQVFRCIPCDDVTSFAQLREFQSQLPLAFTEPAVAQQKLKQIQVSIFIS